MRPSAEEIIVAILHSRMELELCWLEQNRCRVFDRGLTDPAPIGSHDFSGWAGLIEACLPGSAHDIA
jgi:hypothetical protein